MLLQSSNHLGFVERGPHPRRIRVHSTLSGPHLKPLLNATTEPNGCDAQDTSRTCPNSQIPSQNEASEGCILLVQKEQRNKPPLLKSNLLILNPINSATQFNSCTIHGEGNGTPLQDSCLENPMDGGALKAAVHGVAQSRTRLKRLSSSRVLIEIISQNSGYQMKLSIISLLFTLKSHILTSY